MKFTTPSRLSHRVVLMALAMLIIPLVDGLAKYLSTGYSIIPHSFLAGRDTQLPA